ncbi:hypothetical protein NIES4071_94140 [Calothrix sp. NIES-4071]|nr:hypothetical protein NIES4071_94140 [Calothrix sp. NIES-4071]BAZ63679.1 hypothetical protein NIES4105_94070 [Calothrix sp. NIES-4105]
MNTTNTADALTFTVPLSFEAHSLAQMYSKLQDRPNKAKRVYLNTLAIYAVDHYFRCMGFATNWEGSDSRKPILQKFLDIADLNVRGVGKFECRPILPGADKLEVPCEAWDERVGYVAVQLTQSLKEATIIGFVPQIEENQGIIPLNQLRAFDEFPEYLMKVKNEGITVKVPQLVNLYEWLNNKFETHWQSVEEFFSTQTYSIAFRNRGIISEQINPNDTSSLKQFIGTLYANQRNTNSTQTTYPTHLEPVTALSQLIESTTDEETRWKAIELLWKIKPEHPSAATRRVTDLGMRLAGYPVALMVAILPKHDGKRGVLLRVYPMGNQAYLPQNLKLIGLDENGQTLLEVQARGQDNYIQFRFNADPKDKFSVQVSLGEASVTEHFIV